MPRTPSAKEGCDIPRSSFVRPFPSKWHSPASRCKQQPCCPLGNQDGASLPHMRRSLRPSRLPAPRARRRTVHRSCGRACRGRATGTRCEAEPARRRFRPGDGFYTEVREVRAPAGLEFRRIRRFMGLLVFIGAYAGSLIATTRTSFLLTNSWMPILESSCP